MTRPFGRTNEPVATIWRERPDGIITAGDWTGWIVTAADLDRRGGERVRQAARQLGRPFEFVYVRGVLAGDVKVGWPLHRLQRFRDDKLLRYVVIEAADALEAEWIAANAPVHGVAITFSAHDMSAKYRVFDAAANAGVGLVGHAHTIDDAALQLATPSITATLLDETLAAPAPMSSDDLESLWQAYRTSHTEPPKLRGAHPPDFGS